MGVFGVTKLKLGDDHQDDEPPIRVVDAPVGRVWVIGDENLARQAFADPRICKDPAFAPEGWPTWVLGREPTSAEWPSLTSLDGEAHRELRRAHAPLFTAKVLAASRGRFEEIARELLRALPDEVDLAEDFTSRFPLTVVCDRLGIPVQYVTPLVSACRRMVSSDVGQIVAAMEELHRMVGEATAGEFRRRMPERYSAAEVTYVIGAMVFGGQTTTDGAVGFVLAYLLAGRQDQDDAAFVSEILRRHAPLAYTLWR